MKRHIRLLIENATEQEINNLQKYCKEKNLNFNFTEGKEWKRGTLLGYYEEGIPPLYYFTIFGDTNDFNELDTFMNNKLILTHFAEIGNIANLDDSFEATLEKCITSMRESIQKEHKANCQFMDFIMPITDVNTLKAIEKFYSCHMNDTQKKCIKDRIDILSGKKDQIREEFTEAINSFNNDVKKLREKTGMNRKEFSKYFGIPYRTIEDWENKKSTCATYLFNLMEEKLIQEGYIN